MGLFSFSQNGTDTLAAQKASDQDSPKPLVDLSRQNNDWQAAKSGASDTSKHHLPSLDITSSNSSITRSADGTVTAINGTAKSADGRTTVTAGPGAIATTGDVVGTEVTVGSQGVSEGLQSGFAKRSG